jgi:plasmid stabilization system protein ParE
MPASTARLHDEASIEYDAAFDWYLQRSEESAISFDVEVNRAIQLIIESPRRWPMGPYGTRRFLLRRFPFFLIYREHMRGEIQVVAVAHTSRKPGYWKQRL